MSTLGMPLDEAASRRIASGKGVPAPLTALSLAFPGPSSRDRFSSLRRSNALNESATLFTRGTHEPQGF